MKKIIASILCLLTMFLGVAQSDDFGDNNLNFERTPELEALYEQGRQLEDNGTPEEINANIRAIKEAWQTVNPEVAALYGPNLVENTSEPIRAVEGIDTTPFAPEDWGGKKLVQAGKVDFHSMDKAVNGDLYIAAVTNSTSPREANLKIYKTANNGDTFTLFKALAYPNNNLRDIKTVVISGDGQQFVLVFGIDDTGLQVTRVRMDDRSFLQERIESGEVTDFDADPNYPQSTDLQRVMVVYNAFTSSCNTGGNVYSVRSTVGQYGFGYGDKVQLVSCGVDISTSYGLAGAFYTSYIGGNTGNLYGRANNNFADPASWDNPPSIAAGTDTQFRDTEIRATRNAFSSDIVNIIATGRPEGTSNKWRGYTYRRVNGGNFDFIGYYSIPDKNVWYFDMYCYKNDGNQKVQVGMIIDDWPSEAVASCATIEGLDYNPIDPASDPSVIAFYISIVQLNNGYAAMTVTDTQSNVSTDLYFFKDGLLDVGDIKLEDFTYYPNPTDGMLNLSATKDIEKLTFYSLLGQQVLDVAPMAIETSVDLSSLQAGVYLMKVKSGGQTATYKIVRK